MKAAEEKLKKEESARKEAEDEQNRVRKEVEGLKEENQSLQRSNEVLVKENGDLHEMYFQMKGCVDSYAPKSDSRRSGRASASVKGKKPSELH